MEFVWETGKRVGNPRSIIDSSQTPYQGILHSTNQSATGGIPVQRSTGRLVAKDEERIGSTISRPMFAGMPSIMNSFLPVEIPHNSVAVQQRLQTSEPQFDNVFMLEDKIQNPGKFLFRFSLGGHVMHQRSGDGRFSG